jgi:plasmid stabilization system protein ParE
VKNYDLTIAPVVSHQIREQVFYIAQHSIDYALAWEDRLATAIQGLSDMPGYAVDEEASQRLGYEVRKYVFEGTYLVHFRVDEEASLIRVINFRHGSRLPRLGEP